MDFGTHIDSRVGAGNGKFGVLFRDYLEARLDTKRTSVPARQAKIDAVEGFPAYLGELHRAVYDDLYPMLIQDFIVQHETLRYDFIYAGDVLEHLDKEEATRFIVPALLRMSTLGLLIAVPYRDIEQHSVYGNELERHVSHWRAADSDLWHHTFISAERLPTYWLFCRTSQNPSLRSGTGGFDVGSGE